MEISNWQHLKKANEYSSVSLNFKHHVFTELIRLYDNSKGVYLHY